MKRTFLFWLARRMRRLSFTGLFRLADMLGFILWTFLPRRRRETVERIKFHLELPEAEAIRLARASFYSTARSFLEIFLNDKFDSITIHIKHPEMLRRVSQTGQPAILATAHFGAWELEGAFLSQRAERPSLTVSRKQKDLVVSDLIKELRRESGLETVDHRAAAGPTLECMRNGGGVGFLVDHNASRKEAIFLPFFNDVAAVNMGPALLAVRARALVYPAFMRRDGVGEYTLQLPDPLDTTTLEGSLSEKVRQVAEFYTKAVEEEVRKCPEQWFWMHNRWKTRPPENEKIIRKSKKHADAV